MLNKTKTTQDGTVLAIKSSTGASSDELRKDGLNFATSRFSENASVVADGLADGGLD